jgi:2,5-diketo-D-gluconate reductase A
MVSTSRVSYLMQNDGRRIPQIGLGLYGPDDRAAAAAVEAALRIGYRSLDTAALYENEVGVGEGIRQSGIPREELYVTTKLHSSHHGYESARAAFDHSLERLGLDYVDLYLIHWPLPGVDKYVESWKALESILASGRTKSIGVANFQPEHLKRLFAETGVVPAVNQIELHPGFQNRTVRDFNASNGILTEAWSPLGRGRVFENRILEAIARKHSKTIAQTVIRWHLELGNIVIPKSVTPGRQAENLNVFDFRLEAEDMGAIARVENGIRTGDDPNNFNG